MIRKILKWFGYYQIDYGSSCGRHFLEIDGKIIAQTSGDDAYIIDEHAKGIIDAVFHNKARNELEYNEWSLTKLGPHLSRNNLHVDIIK